MEITDQPKALDDLKYWKRSDQKQLQQRILTLLQSIKDTPFESIGKPEPLKHQWTGMWPRRINGAHRITMKLLTTNKRLLVERSLLIDLYRYRLVGSLVRFCIQTFPLQKNAIFALFKTT